MFRIAKNGDLLNNLGWNKMGPTIIRVICATPMLPSSQVSKQDNRKSFFDLKSAVREESRARTIDQTGQEEENKIEAPF